MINENVKVMIIGGDVKTKDIIKSMIEAVDGVALVEDSGKFYIRNSHEPIEPIEPIEVEHGAYRQFIKRDKRKNFKVNK